MTTEGSKPARGRPPAESAEAHEAIINAVFDLLHEMSVKDLTMEKVAKRAKVGKPTLYRWWPSKAALVATMFNERIVPSLNSVGTVKLEDTLKARMDLLIHAFSGFFGKVLTELIAEGQSDPAILEELNQTYTRARRMMTVTDIKAARGASIDAELIVDVLFGTLYYQRLLGVAPLTEGYAAELLASVKKVGWL